MQSENSEWTSFFDSDEYTFEFQKSCPQNDKFLEIKPSMEGLLLRQASNTLTQGSYALHHRILVFKQTLDAKDNIVLDIGHSRLNRLNDENDEIYGFSVTRNGVTHKFFSKNQKDIDNWINACKGACVLNNFHDEYKALKMIGKGSFAKVYLVESKLHKDKKHFAVKAFTKEGVLASNKNNEANGKKSILNEIDINRFLEHEHVLRIYEVYETERSIYLVLELIQGKTLHEVLKKQGFQGDETTSRKRIVNAISSLLSALAYLRARKVMHRDLKPDNILIDKNDKITIIDFGLATFLDVPEYIFKKCGTPGYIAPEVFKYDMKKPETSYDGRCDVFSLGCLLYYMFFGKSLFEGSNASEILKNNRRFTIESDIFANIKKELKDPDSKIPKEGLDLLLQLLEFDKLKRPTAEEALRHPFLIPSPSDMHRISGLDDSGIKGYSRNSNYSPSLNSPYKRSSTSTSPDKHSPMNRERYHEKDSLNLNLGKPEINGRIDTLNSGTANSLMFSKNASDLNSPEKGSNNSMSPFGKEFKKSGLAKSFKGHSSISGHPTSFKTMTSNMHKQDDASPAIRSELGKKYKSPDFMGSHFSDKSKSGSNSPNLVKSDLVANSAQHQQFSLKIEQVQTNSVTSMTKKGNGRLVPLKNHSDIIPRK